MTEERIKMNVDLRILNATCMVQQDMDCCVQWTRGAQSIKTGKKKLTVEEKKVKFDSKNSTFKNTCSFYQNSETQVWKSDKNSLTLFCGTVAVGKCEFDLESYIGKEPKYQTAVIVEESYQATEDERVLKGKAGEYPGAEICFRISVSKSMPRPSVSTVVSDNGSARSGIREGGTNSRSVAGASSSSSSQLEQRRAPGSAAATGNHQQPSQVEESNEIQFAAIEKEILRKKEKTLATLRKDYEAKLAEKEKILKFQKKTREALEQEKQAMISRV